jgi:hypothetical protein
LLVAVMANVCAAADFVSSHRKAQCPFSEVCVLSSVTLLPVTENLASRNPSPCTNNMGEGNCAHQPGGSILSILGLPIGT